MRYCGRTFTVEELETIRRFAADPTQCPTREALARAVCTALAWVKPDAGLKTMSAKVALLRMARDGLLILPPPRHGNGRISPPITTATDPGPQWDGQRGQLATLRLTLVGTRSASRFCATGRSQFLSVKV